MLNPDYKAALDEFVETGSPPKGPFRKEIIKSFKRWVVLSVINRALLDISPSRSGRKIRRCLQEDAIRFLRSSDCKSLCVYLGTCYNILLEKAERLWKDLKHG